MVRSVMFFSAMCLMMSEILIAQPAQQAVIPDTPVGKLARSYLVAFNSGAESNLRAFFLDHASPASFDQNPVAQRVRRSLQMRSEIGEITVRRLIGSSDFQLSILVQTRRGDWLTFEFRCDSQPPHYLAGIGIDQSSPELADQVRAANIDELIRRVKSHIDTLARNDQFSGVVLIAQNGKPLLLKACGYADRKKRIPNATDTKFNIGSINKTFTKLAILRLASEGKLSLSDTLKKFLPDYPNKDAANKVTVQHLLDMTSEIGDFFGERYRNTPKERIRTISDYLPLFADLPLQFEPGTSRRYSNGGYIVLGAIIEKVTRRDYYDRIRETIFKPAGMMDTDWFDKDARVNNLALGYTRQRGEEWVQNYETLPGRGSSAGGGYSTATDLLKYTIALSEGKFNVPGYEGVRGLGVAGGAPGLNAALEWDPRSGSAIVVMSNFDPPSAERVARTIRAWVP
ncbi:MAG: beta-lactamase family protein [Ignavibacteria bacterium]|nr:beta-lactamase family protein [Ignavibacteria bacterium]